MRPILFRCWDKNFSRMHHDYCKSLENGAIYTILYHTNHELVLQQFIGTFDRKGQRIYEGDIVKLLYTDWTSKPQEDTRTIEEYKWDKANVYTVVYEGHSFKGEYYSHKYKESSTSSLWPGKYGFIEVIGNIYENPKLLEEENK